MNYYSNKNFYDNLSDEEVSKLIEEKSCYIKRIISKKQVRTLLAALNRFEYNDLISIQDAIIILGYNDRPYKNFIELFRFETFKIEHSIRGFRKSDIELVLREQMKIGTEYLSMPMITEQYGFQNILQDKAIYIPLCLNNRNLFSTVYKVFKKEDVEKYAEKNILLSSEYETFLFRLNSRDDLSFFQNSQYTKQAFVQFAKTKLNLREEGKKFLDYLRLAEHLNTMMEKNNVEEFFEIQTAPIIDFANTEMGIITRQILSQYIVFSDRCSFCKCNFSLNKIQKSIKLSNRKIVKDNVDIYSIDEYFKIFNFLLDIPYHVEKSIQEIQQKNKISYLSIWIHSMFLLNNTWRRDDAARFPRLAFQDILFDNKIDNINWFLYNNISQTVSKQVIARVFRFDYLFSKTNQYGHFFCSEDLRKPIATGLLILECYWIDKINAPKLYEPVFKNFPRKEKVKEFYDSTGISFSSLKMNRTVMTLVYRIASEKFHTGYDSLLLPKYMRAHVDTNSTLHYVNFSQKQFDEITERLFRGGEFGYIYNSLIAALPNNTTPEQIKQNFGDVYKVENTLAMLNFIKNERQEVITLIETYGYKKCQNIITNIYLKNLPSKQPDIQCLFANQKCPAPNKDCLDCQYSIPNIYILKAIGNTITSDMENFFITKNSISKIKLSYRIHKRVMYLIEAIDIFGKDFVYEFADIPRDSFLIKLQNVPEPKELEATIL